MTASKIFGSILILIGTTIGAGMLALPMVSASAGFTWSAILMLGLWIITVMTGLMIIEVNLAFPMQACSFSTMAEKTIGPIGMFITWLSYLMLLYAATAAYITGATSLITNTIEVSIGLKIPNSINAILFTLILGGAVYWSTSAVDYLNRGLLSIKGIALFITLFLILPHINISYLTANQTLAGANFLWAASPVFICSLCYHIVLPSIRIYIGDNYKALKIIIFVGTATSLIVYLLWLAGTLGLVPLAGNISFAALAKMNGSVGEFMATLVAIVKHDWINVCVSLFANIAMTTSFLGVSLGLFDFLADGFKRKNTRIGRLQTASLTYIPPLLFALFYPKGFLIALNYAAVFIAILSLILPTAMVYRLRKNPSFKSSYRFFGGNIILGLIFIIGIILAVLPILVNMNLLPAIH